MSSDFRPIWDLVDIAYRAVNAVIAQRLGEAGFPEIRAVHGKVFETIGQEGSRVTTMAERAQMTKQAMGELVAYLEAAGYVERTRDPSDRRAKIVRLTEHGWDAVRAAVHVLDELYAEWERLVGQEELYRAQRLLDQLVGIVESQIQSP